jgi:hypothetical protein
VQGADNNIPGSALFLAGDSASRLSVGVAASHMRPSERATRRTREKKGKERNAAKRGTSKVSLSFACEAAVSWKFYLLGLAPDWAHFASLCDPIPSIVQG